MPKKSNTKRADGRYSVRVYIGMVNGVKKYKSVYGKTQKEANQKADEIRTAMKKGIDITSSNDTFAAWTDYWLVAKKAEVSADRYIFLKSKAEFYKSCLGHFKITQIKPFELQQLINQIAAENPNSGQPSARKTIRDYSHILYSIFDHAIDNRVIEFNPASKLKIPLNAPVNHRRALTAEERQRVIEFEHRAQPAAMLMMLSGLRRGEATALQWSDIDFKNNTISVTKSYNFKQKEFKSTKTGKSRIVTVPQILIDYLSTLPRISPFVLTSAKGDMMTETSWKRLFDSYMTDMNLKYGCFTEPQNKHNPKKAPMMITPFTPHELRHTFCTIMYEAGIDVLVAKEQMGHSDISTTLGIYTHLNEEHRKADVSKLNDFLKNEKYVSKVRQII